MDCCMIFLTYLAMVFSIKCTRWIFTSSFSNLFLAGFLVDRSQAFWLERLFAKRLAFYTTTQLIWLLGDFIAVATSCKVFLFSKFGRRQKDPDVTKQTANANLFFWKMNCRLSILVVRKLSGSQGVMGHCTGHFKGHRIWLDVKFSVFAIVKLLKHNKVPVLYVKC